MLIFFDNRRYVNLTTGSVLVFACTCTKIQANLMFQVFLVLRANYNIEMNTENSVHFCVDAIYFSELDPF